MINENCLHIRIIISLAFFKELISSWTGWQYFTWSIEKYKIDSFLDFYYIAKNVLRKNQ